MEEAAIIELSTLGFFQAATKVIKVKHGRKVFSIQTDDKCTGMTLRKTIASHFGTIPGNIRLFAKGGSINDGELLTGVTEAMLLFSGDYHSQLSGDAWLDQFMSELTSIEVDLAGLERAVAHRAMATSIETQYTLNGILDRIQSSLSSIDRIKLTSEGEDKASKLVAKLTELEARARSVNLTQHR